MSTTLPTHRPTNTYSGYMTTRRSRRGVFADYRETDKQRQARLDTAGKSAELKERMARVSANYDRLDPQAKRELLAALMGKLEGHVTYNQVEPWVAPVAELLDVWAHNLVTKGSVR